MNDTYNGVVQWHLSYWCTDSEIALILYHSVIIKFGFLFKTSHENCCNITTLKIRIKKNTNLLNQAWGLYN